MDAYFGILKQEETDKLSTEEFANFMIDSGLFYLTNSYSMELKAAAIHFSDKEVSHNLLPSKDLERSFYNFLKEVFKSEIDLAYLKYFNDFNESIFGLAYEKQREIALDYFKTHYKSVKVLKADILLKEKSENNIDQVKSINKFDFLWGRQNAIKTSLWDFNNDYLHEYMNGNNDYFHNPGLLQEPSIKFFLEFESILKFLVSLNDTYKFEDDFRFSERAILKELYEKYDDLFMSFDAFEFAHNRIKQFTQLKSANCTSLFDALEALKLVINNKSNFIKYLQIEHNSNQTKLKLWQKWQNKEHHARVKLFTDELAKYAESE